MKILSGIKTLDSRVYIPKLSAQKINNHIKEITGHKKDSVFNKYVKISEEFKKLEMERTWDSIPQHVNKQKPAGERKNSE